MGNGGHRTGCTEEVTFKDWYRTEGIEALRRPETKTVFMGKDIGEMNCDELRASIAYLMTEVCKL